ncbi:hypothetical protein SAMN05444748_10179 [Variovorax sp. OV700]|nr:hypothetical protein SAMN05444748_10179 [Variovorax sp. OV700]
MTRGYVNLIRISECSRKLLIYKIFFDSAEEKM